MEKKELTNSSKLININPALQGRRGAGEKGAVVGPGN
jgi:hypothetical protein